MLRGMTDDRAWMASAACRTHDPEVFFPHQGGGHTAEAARGICGGCPVIEDCRRYAARLRWLEGPLSGVWGGVNFRTVTRTHAALLVSSR